MYHSLFREIRFTGEFCEAKLRVVITYIRDDVSASDFSAVFICKNIIYEGGRTAAYSSYSGSEPGFSFWLFFLSLQRMRH